MNKLELKGGFDKIAEFINEKDIEILPITFGHLQRLLQLKFHHRDPFDRIIIAQAINESLSIATKDKDFYKHEVTIVWQ